MSSIAQKPETQTTCPGTNDDQVVNGRLRTVALIGPDGAGKTAVAEALLENCPLPLKYLYMGTSIESSNVALPTSRLIHRFKVWQQRRSLVRTGDPVPDKITLHGMEHRVERRGKLGASARLLRRVSEESYRQLVSWMYQLQGNIVLYDRHFLFDACPAPEDTGEHRLTDRINHWFLTRLYPRPQLAIFLDAPSEVLFARKQEVPASYIEREREKLAQKSGYAKKFVAVDADRPLDEVVDIVTNLVMKHCSRESQNHNGQTSHS